MVQVDDYVHMKKTAKYDDEELEILQAWVFLIKRLQPVCCINLSVGIW